MNFVIKGNIYFCLSKNEIKAAENAYLVCINGKSAGVFDTLPQEYQQLELFDYSGKTVIPGLIDLHAHAPQYSYRGTAMDLELLDWLEKYTFPEESKFADREYAKKSYSVFVDDLLHSATTRASLFATVHREGTMELMSLLEESGLITCVGKLNQDRNCPDYIVETTQGSADETRKWIDECNFLRTKPIITPRFIPTCSDSLMQAIGELAAEKNVPVQSHLSENSGEIAWVKELCPWAKNYGDVYERFGFMGKPVKSIMAHCIWSDDDEIALMKERETFVAHCPLSNSNVIAGIAPVKKYLEKGLKVGFGSDVAGGNSLNLFESMRLAIQLSKLRWRLVEGEYSPLSVEEVFYMATKGGGEFFGKVGSFEPDYELDAVVIDDSLLKSVLNFNLHDRLERIIYLADERHIAAKFVAGRKVI